MSGLFNDDTLSLYLKLKEAMKQYVRDAMPGGALSPEYGKPSSVMENYRHPMGGGKYINTEEPLGPPTVGPLSLDPTDYIGPKTLANIGLMAKAAIGPAMLGGLLATSKNSVPSMMRQSGQIAWHGSPHKFPPVRELLMPDGTKLIQDLTQSTHLPEGAKVIAEHPFGKFDLSKIGSGEGAQAYGHGLYLAESKNVADSYSSIGKVLHNIGEASFDGVPASRLPWLKDNTPEELALRVIGTEKSVDKGLRVLERLAKSDKDYAAAKQFFDANKSRIDWQSARPEMENATPNLYKTDIPDEAVARFLDWDKPLSEQAKEVQAALQKAAEIRAKQTGGAFGPLDMGQVGRDVVHTLGEGRLRDAGIPGIRYLDGGSRGAGTGTSNFVVFDPEMIRILERNGQPTGLQPWQPGEWEGLFKK